MAIKYINELEGPALDWAVAKAIGLHSVRIFRLIGGVHLTEAADPDYFGCRGYVSFFPSTDWNTGGPIAFKYKVGMQYGSEVDDLEDYVTDEEPCYSDCGNFWAIGKTPLISAMRALVQKLTLGDYIEVPDLLL